jgi:hypothetical protein
MISPKFIGIAIVCLAVVGIGAHFATPLLVVKPAQPEVVIHTPAWYEAHQDILAQDDQTCQSDGANAPAAMCQNVQIAAQAVCSANAIRLSIRLARQGSNRKWQQSH